MPKRTRDNLSIYYIFSNVERLFTILLVLDELKITLMKPYLADKCISLLNRLTVTDVLLLRLREIVFVGATATCTFIFHR